MNDFVYYNFTCLSFTLVKLKHPPLPTLLALATFQAQNSLKIFYIADNSHTSIQLPLTHPSSCLNFVRHEM